MQQLRGSSPSQTFPGWGELAAFGATLLPREVMLFPVVVAGFIPFCLGTAEILLSHR